jgi:hypothetical protein
MTIESRIPGNRRIALKCRLVGAVTFWVGEDGVYDTLPFEMKLIHG